MNGDNAQLAWDNRSAEQTQNHDIAPGFEALAEVLTALLASLPSLGLAPGDEAEVRSNAETVLGGVVKAGPDRGVVKRGVTMLKGLLAPVAAGDSTAVTSESTELAKTVIDGLGSTLPFQPPGAAGGARNESHAPLLTPPRSASTCRPVTRSRADYREWVDGRIAGVAIRFTHYSTTSTAPRCSSSVVVSASLISG